MSFSYTITETEKENLPDGDVIADLVSVEEKVFTYNGQMNSAVVIGWDIIDPVELTGRTEYETFYTGHSDPKKAAFGKWKFSVLCKQIAQLKTGETVSREHLLGKRAQLTVKNNVADNGKVYQNFVNRVLLPSQSKADVAIAIASLRDAGAASNSLTYGGIQIPEVPSVSTVPLNDEVPF